MSYTTTILFSTANSTKISSVCSASSSGSSSTAPCVCKFSWEEINTETADTVPIARVVETSVTAVQQSLVTCSAPSVYSTEINDDTLIKITVAAASGNSASFTVDPYTYTKSGAASTGSFLDAEGRAYDNIHRYSCYEQFQRGMTLSSKAFTTTNQSSSTTIAGKTISVLYASQFCVAKASGGETSSTECENIPEAENSAQAYYYNLYIRNTDRGGVNEQNTRYVCPKVKESLNHAGTVGSDGQFWPMDTSFALALTPSADFSVSVEGPSRLSIGGDSSSQSSVCTGSGSSSSGASSDDSSLLSTCLGFAAKPASDGTCPYFKDSNGLLRLTYRLRKFHAIYPPTYDTDGSSLEQSPAIDTIFVLDRPLTSSGADPLKPYTMRGPKPCPFAFFDHKGVLGDPDDVNYPGGMPGYASTNYSGWNGLNVDGIQFPNTDVAGSSCSAIMPLYNTSTGFLSLATLNEKNPVRKVAYVRPIRAWAPHYEEDTGFQACAPQAQPMADPPLHFSKDTSTGNVSWCAEAYPSQNDNVGSVDVRTGGSGDYPGYVLPYTSHVAKHSASGNCSATPLALPTGYPSKPSGSCPTPSSSSVPSTYGAAHHPAPIVIDSKLTSTGATEYGCADQTCDRTVMNAGLTWARFPLLSRAPMVESAISADSTYACMVSYDGGLGKKGKSTPTGGCCGSNVKVVTGTTTSGVNYTSAHLEPDSACLTPSY